MLEDSGILLKVYRFENNKVEMIPIEDIVKMKVISQLNINFHIELIKAQAIIARTELVRNAKCFGGEGCKANNECDICDKDHNIYIMNDEYLKEMWKTNYEKNIHKLNRAIEETKGLIITFNNKPINAKYHSTCGGATENSENVLGNEIIYLRKVLCDYCKKAPYWENRKIFLLKEIEEKLNVRFPKIASDLQTEINGFIDDVEKDESGRVIAVKIGGKKFKGKDIMEIFDLNSTRFSVTPNTISFNTRGKGYGLGLCQYGANEMAIQGYSFENILKYYYTGIEIRKYHKPCIKKPLNGKIIILDPVHGGENCKDIVGVKGLREKDVVLKIAKKVECLLKDLGAKVLLTREEDKYLSLGKRAQFANKNKPDFFINISLNSFPSPSIQGCEIYFYKGDKDGELLGKSIMSSLVKKIGIIDRGVKVADFFLLKDVRNSSIQIFVDYITNPQQEKKFKDINYIDEISKGIVAGIVDYYRY